MNSLYGDDYDPDREELSMAVRRRRAEERRELRNAFSQDPEEPIGEDDGD